ncbi:MAG: tripartite tricarboxylate transporter substrate binding protein [Betaproteobacteria bacterium]|nr:tripartite tricarboxylate transporter substrate binding protein [Betaproteobacteria bacterium]
MYPHVAFAVAAALLSCAAGAQGTAQSFPTKPVRIIVAFPPGGGTDIVARILGQKLGESWGQQAIVDNRAGASGVIGTEAAARAAPDGYTWFMGTMGNLTVNQHLYQKMPVDPQRDLTAMSQVVAVHFVMVSHPSLPAKNVKDLIALARARPGLINYSSSGPGGAPHLGGELLKSMAGINLVHIPYKGSGPSFTDLLGGQVSLTFDSLVQAYPYIKAGRLNALAVLGSKRSKLLPQTPTIAESGVPGYELTNWFGLVVPSATPRELIQRLHGDVSKALAQPDVRDKLQAMGADVIGSNPEQFAGFMREETAKWAKVVRQANIRAE